MRNEHTQQTLAVVWSLTKTMLFDQARLEDIKAVTELLAPWADGDIREVRTHPASGSVLYWLVGPNLYRLQLCRLILRKHRRLQKLMGEVSTRRASRQRQAQCWEDEMRTLRFRERALNKRQSEVLEDLWMAEIDVLDYMDRLKAEEDRLWCLHNEVTSRIVDIEYAQAESRSDEVSKFSAN